MSIKTVLIVVLASAFILSVGIFSALPVHADPIPNITPPQNIFIRSDGSVNPSNVSISRVGNTYTLTGNIFNSQIIIQCDNVLLNGAGFTLSYDENNYYGLTVGNVTGVVVKNLNITGFLTGIYIENCSNISALTNNVSKCEGFGIDLVTSNHADVASNQFISDYTGIGLINSVSNTITQNTMLEQQAFDTTFGFSLFTSGDNTISQNTLFNCSGSDFNFFNSSSNLIYHNNLISRGRDEYFDPNYHATYPTASQSLNIWDSGVEGNYWSSYQSKYPNATETGDSGIWNTPFSVYANNTDNYPLMNQVDINNPSPNILNISIVSPMNGTTFTVSFGQYPHFSIPLIYTTNTALSWVGYSLNGESNVTVTGNGTLVNEPSINNNKFTLTLYANDTSGNWATPQTVTCFVYVPADVSPSVPEVPTWIILPSIFLAAVLVTVTVTVRKKNRGPRP